MQKKIQAIRTATKHTTKKREEEKAVNIKTLKPQINTLISLILRHTSLAIFFSFERNLHLIAIIVVWAFFFLISCILFVYFTLFQLAFFWCNISRWWNDAEQQRREKKAAKHKIRDNSDHKKWNSTATQNEVR